MTRFFFSALALATLGLAGPAAAEDCLCIGPDSFTDLASDALSPIATPAAAPGGVTDGASALEDGAQESPDPLAPALEIVEPSAQRAGGPVLWCISPDDPRCQRDDSGEAPHRTTLSTAPIAPLPATPHVPRASSTNVELVSDEARPLAGIHVRLDRPPRA